MDMYEIRRALGQRRHIRTALGAQALPEAATATSTNWCGYISTVSTSYTAVTASWTVPTITGSTAANYSGASFWVGLDGWNSPTVEQCGLSVVNPPSGSPNQYFVWSEFYPSYEAWWDPITYPVTAGDSFSASIGFDGSYFNLTLADATKGWSYTVKKALTAAKTEEAQTSIARNSIEVIVEDNFSYFS